MTSSVPTSLRVVEGVAAHEGVDPVELEPPLHEVIDTDALDALFQSTGDSSATIEFTYRGKRVCVDDSGQVQVTEASSNAGGSTVAE
ncbi:HalOD1 output domain-containing protein [Natrinema versiforme]|uniref:Halobacterial output domain-containing protein n=1 Tax=Natrinema versiforme TaxID=88724 RepID=A0A4P8WEK1_9EURY|nr:HalOD1 output domain-containing protein [Natrinema versiforme]QCS41689.1 hypothetical protein FEJ81_04725 [Natrinema versiforme]